MFRLADMAGLDIEHAGLRHGKPPCLPDHLECLALWAKPRAVQVNRGHRHTVQYAHELDTEFPSRLRVFSFLVPSPLFFDICSYPRSYLFHLVAPAWLTTGFEPTWILATQSSYFA